MSTSAENVVDMRLDGNLRGESEKEDGVNSLTSARGPKETLTNAHYRRKRMWNTFFLLACCVAVFIDPLFCYVYVISEDLKCYTADSHLMLAYFWSRIIMDAVYMIDAIISLLGIIRKKHNNIAKRFEACCWRIRSGSPTTVMRSPHSKGNPSIKASLHKQLHLLPRILVALPILEIIILIILIMELHQDDYSSVLYYTFNTTIPIQYLLRIYDIYALLRRRHLVMKIGIERWFKPILDFLPFILASHLFGALWYRLAIQRQLTCWMKNGKALKEAQCSTLKGAQHSDLKGAQLRALKGVQEYCLSTQDFSFACENLRKIWQIQPNVISTYASLSDKLCPVREENSTAFDFGIFRRALQSNQTFVRRVSQSFWWALQNLSSFGSNLNTSSLPLEIYFSILVSISGMTLFLVYLNTRVKELTAKKKKSKELKAKKKKLMIPDIDLWLSKNDLPKDLKINEKKDLKTVIMDNIPKLEKHEVIDAKSILSVLPFHDKKRIVYLLCKASLRKVPQLESTNEKVLMAIAEHLKLVTYNEDEYIVQEGKPLGKMFFITQGIAWTYKANGAAGTIFDSKWLKRGSCCGEELLDWAFKSPLLSNVLPNSTRTVISQEQVEAFAIRASDLNTIVVKFWWYFSMKVTNVSQLEQWKELAASSIQVAWRHHLQRPGA